MLSLEASHLLRERTKTGLQVKFPDISFVKVPFLRNTCSPVFDLLLSFNFSLVTKPWARHGIT